MRRETRVRAKAGEILAVFPTKGFSIIRAFDGEEFFGHFQNYVGLKDEREIQKGVTVTFQPFEQIAGIRPKALLIEIERAISIQGAA